MVNQDIKCNMCGESCSLGPLYGDGLDGDKLDYNGLLNVKVAGGYNSTPGNGNGALDDMTRYGFSMCEFCLDWLFQQFKIPVTVDDYMNDDNYLPKAETNAVQLPAWKCAEARVNEDEWRQSKEEFHQENNRRSLLRKNHG
jgi:hypothetical protein